MPVCSACNENVEKYFVIKRKLCERCYKKIQHQNRKKEICICGECRVVNKRINGKAVCSSCCEKYFRISEECCICNEYDVVAKRTTYGPVCNECYKALYRGDEECCICHEYKPPEAHTKDGPVCKRCYKQPERECCVCHRIRKIKARNMCDNCEHKDKRKNDEGYRIICLLRDRLYMAFKLFSTTGKTKHADEYGINYEKIIEHLGPCPGSREDYHIDHIKPLCSFDFDDPEQIKIAFAPENHQWLTIEENLKKGAKL